MKSYIILNVEKVMICEQSPAHKRCQRERNYDEKEHATVRGLFLSMGTSPGAPVELLVLGKGWTGAYVVRAANETGVSVAATTRNGRDGTIAWEFAPESNDPSRFNQLPNARTVLVTFPVLSRDAMRRLTDFYETTRPAFEASVRWILLGTTSNFNPPNPAADPWCDRHTPLTNLAPRNEGEAQLLQYRSSSSTVIHLAGLYDAKERNPRNFVSRVAPTKQALLTKKSVHYIHGVDVARAILAVHAMFERAVGQRWILCNIRVYDWWEFLGCAVPTGWDLKEEGDPEVWSWVLEACRETGVKGLPRNVTDLGRGMDGRDFWETFGVLPRFSQL
ncbi:hypothetical protein BC830DRAFT_660777 [Chytriomyces sp. MP71]|nr:hypothetical protein BC830DRAFT_660777 [Chytriomyces sp. MP71]